MLIRFVDGLRKGEVCDVLPHTAKHLCNVGTAVDASDKPVAPAVEVEAQAYTILPDVIPTASPPPPPKPLARKNKRAKAKRSR